MFEQVPNIVKRRAFLALGFEGSWESLNKIDTHFQRDFTLKMDISLVCVVIMVVWTIFSKAPMAWAMKQKSGGYNNREPRVQRETLEGWARRADAAHQNTIEALPIFASCVFVSKLGATPSPNWVAWACVTFVLVRFLYVWAYISDAHIVRSTLWIIGFALSIGIGITGIV